MGIDRQRKGFSYFLRNLPAPVIISYLKRYYNWRCEKKSDLPLNLFVRYYNTPIPENYQKLLRLVPQLCINQHSHLLKYRFLLIATLEDLVTIAEITPEFFQQELLLELGRHCKISKFQIRDQSWHSDDPKVVGILNITPDSFYDGGLLNAKSDFVSIARKMVEDGVDLIDIGGESTRPGAEQIGVEEEIARIRPAVESIRNRFSLPISIDTTKVEVAEAALQLGADMINDVSGLSQGERMLETVAKYGASYCIMHTQGEPQTMQKNPTYSDLIAEIYFFFQQIIARCGISGIPPHKLLIDPGIGFGKSVDHNLNILRLLSAFTNLPSSIMLGTSNKSFMGKILNADLQQRLSATVATQVMGLAHGASFFRVHNVKEVKDAISITGKYFT